MLAEEQRSGGVQSGVSLPPARQRVLWSGLPGLGSSGETYKAGGPQPWRGRGEAMAGALMEPWWGP